MKLSSSSHLCLFGLLASLATSVSGLGQNATVTLSPGNGLLQLAGSDINGQILVSANDWWGVLRAAEDLAGDVGKVVGRNLTLGNWMAAGPGKRDVQEERDVSVGPQGGGPGEGGPEFPAGAHSGGWGWGANGGSGAHLPPSPGHNASVTGSSGTTVYYTFNPVTNFVNVSASASQFPFFPLWRVGFGLHSVNADVDESVLMISANSIPWDRHKTSLDQP
jgi:hypothetical protein